MSPKILVVDDEQDIRLLARFILKPAGYEVAEAGDGAECLQKIEQEDPALLLLDIRMPQMDGWQVLERVKADERFKALPVVMMSAHSSGHTLAAAQDAGCDGYVIKPFKERELLAAVDGLLP